MRSATGAGSHGRSGAAGIIGVPPCGIECGDRVLDVDVGRD
jgi:hypothetical protein